MTDWNHQEINALLDDIDRLELIEPEEVNHPSRSELDAYVNDALSPFARAALEKHFETCEQCASYLSEAFEKDLEDRKVLSFSRPRTDALPNLRWFALAAASWAIPMLAMAWVFHQINITPIAVETQPTRVVSTAYAPGISLDTEALSRPIVQKVNDGLEDFLRNYRPATEHSVQPSEGEFLVTLEEIESEFNRRAHSLVAQALSQFGAGLESQILRTLNTWTTEQPVLRAAAVQGQVPKCRPSKKSSDGPQFWAADQSRQGASD